MFVGVGGGYATLMISNSSEFTIRTGGAGFRIDGSDLPVQSMGVKEAKSADHHHVGGCRHLLFLGQKQLIAANVLSTELIGWFAEVLRKLPDGVQVQPDRGRRIMSDLEVLQHPLSKWGHNKNSFRCDHITNRDSRGGSARRSHHSRLYLP